LIHLLHLATTKNPTTTMSDNEDEVAKDVEMEDNAEDATVSV
jgi:hypothetical protein